uniref:hypothetical protein n=1 Tax=uncultured Sphingomonas sp. TaxID=158754 RepID=UPI0025F1E5B5
LVLALVGNLHARLTPSASYQTYTPMAGYLPPDKVASIDVRSDGGSMWACMDNGCRVQNLGPTSGDRTRALVLDNGIADGYSGVLYLGVPATASLPQKAE